MHRLNELDEVVQKCLDDKWHHMLKEMPKKKVKEFFNRHVRKKKAAKRKGAEPDAGASAFNASSLYSSFRLETEILGSGESFAEARRAAELHSDPFATIRLTRHAIEKQLPHNIRAVKEINSN